MFVFFLTAFPRLSHRTTLSRFQVATNVNPFYWMLLSQQWPEKQWKKESGILQCLGKIPMFEVIAMLVVEGFLLLCFLAYFDCGLKDLWYFWRRVFLPCRSADLPNKPFDPTNGKPYSTTQLRVLGVVEPMFKQSCPRPRGRTNSTHPLRLNSKNSTQFPSQGNNLLCLKETRAIFQIKRVSIFTKSPCFASKCELL